MIIAQEPESFTLRLLWDTDVIPLAGGKEQRSANEQLPTLEIEAEYILDRADLAAVRTSLFREYLDEHEIALWTFETTVAGSTAVDNILVDELSAAPVAAIGRRLLLRVPGLDDHVATVTVVGAVGADSLLTLDPPPPAAYRAVGVLLLPLIGVYLRDNQSTGKPRFDEIGRWNLSAVSTSFFTSLGAGGAAVSTYNSYYLLDIPPSIGDKEMLTEQHQANLAGLEGLGPLLPVSYFEYGNIARQTKFAWGDEADRQFWFNFFATVEGRRVPFLFPTWRSDLEAPSGVVDASDELVVSGTPDYRLMWAAKSHKHIAVMWSDGTFQPIEVTNVDDNFDGTLTLTLADDIDVPAGEEFDRVSFLEVVRLADDKIEIHGKHGQASFDLPVVTVQDDP